MKRLLLFFILFNILYFSEAQTTSSLIASYPFCGNANNTTSIPNINGSVVGATLTMDRFGNPNSAYAFGGTSFSPNFINCGTSPSLKMLGNKVTVSVWIKITGDGYNYGRIVLGAQVNTQYSLTKADFNDDRIYWRPLDYGDVYTASNVSRDVWHHIAATYDGSSSKIYVDGKLSNTTNVTGTFAGNSKEFLIGGETTAHGGGTRASYFDGAIDDVKIFSEVLSDSEILALKNEIGPCTTTTSPVISSITGLVAYYPFCGNANDVSGNGNNGTVTGAILTADKLGNPNSAYYFDGSDYIRINRTISQNFSISFWFKTTLGGSNCSSTNNQWHCGYGMIDADRSDCRNDFGISINNGKVDFGIGSSTCGNENYLNTSTLFNDNTWHHVVAVRSISGFTRIYVDNVLKTSSTSNSESLTDPTRITFGGMENTINDPNLIIQNFIGSLDNIKIYNIVLSDHEITDLYNETASCSNVAPCSSLTDSTFTVSYNSPITSDCIATLSITSSLPSNKFLWSTGEIKSVITVRESGTYTIKTYNTCKSKIDTIKVTINKIADRIPNIITPNHDLVNDIFSYEGCFAAGIDFTFLVYNRWGTKVYESKSYKLDWDAEGLSDGVYYYLLTDNESLKVIKGVLQVLR